MDSTWEAIGEEVASGENGINIIKIDWGILYEMYNFFKKFKRKILIKNLKNWILTLIFSVI